MASREGAHMFGCSRLSTTGTSSSSRTTSFMASSSPRISAALKARSLTVSMYSISILYVISQRLEGGSRSTHIGHCAEGLSRVQG